MAKSFYWHKNLKKTKPRLSIYSVLKQTELAISAPNIASILEKQGDNIWLSTIYRVLDDFWKSGMITKTKITENGLFIYEIINDTHRHYAVCLACNKVISIEKCPIHSTNLHLDNFEITGHNLQIYGFCTICSETNSQMQQYN